MGLKFREFNSTSRLLEVSVCWCSRLLDLGVPAREINAKAYLLVRRHGLDTPVVVGTERLVGTERQRGTGLLVQGCWYRVAGGSKSSG